MKAELVGELPDVAWLASLRGRRVTTANARACRPGPRRLMALVRMPGAQALQEVVAGSSMPVVPNHVKSSVAESVRTISDCDFCGVSPSVGRP